MKNDDAPLIFAGRRLAFFSLGFFRPPLRQRFAKLGITLVPFGISRHDGVIVWGRKAVSARGRRYAHWRKLPMVTVEDAFLRSVHPSWDETPVGLTLDPIAPHYARESALIELLENLSDINHQRARGLIDLLRDKGISKYNGVDRGEWKHRNYVLIIDQVRGDASIEHGGISAETFAQMLSDARKRFPNKTIIIRAHPAGQGHFDDAVADSKTIISTQPANIWDVLLAADAVFIGTSQLGFEAILAGHRPTVYGHPFYAGWGLSDDQQDIERKRKIDVETLFSGAMIEYPQWFDAAGQPAEIEDAIAALEVRIRHDRLQRSYQFKGFRPWKRVFIREFFPKGQDEQTLSWGARSHPTDWIVEDAFLRSRGLGAQLVEPMSLVVDKSGIYFDPTQPSDLEQLIKSRRRLSQIEQRRILKLQRQIVDADISKYNLAAEPVDLPDDHQIVLVPGQVENDKSILLGATGSVQTNAELLASVRRDFPDAFIVYKPHPDVEAGLRRGNIDPSEADLIYRAGGLDTLWPQVDAVATITSLTGFEALMRNKKVVCYGMPFYADWGLTDDRAPTTGRRGDASLASLVYASLIDYPLYYDPVCDCPSTPEVIVRRLSSGEIRQSWSLRASARVQLAFYRIRAKLSGE